MHKLDENELFICTTDTVLGIGGKINDKNLENIFMTKRRSPNKRVIVVVSSIEQLKTMESLNNKQIKIANSYWPGDTTLIINGNGYRMPNNDGLLELININGPLYLSSANISGQSECKNIDEAKQVFKEINKFFDFGLGSGKPSKIINIDNGDVIRK